MRCPNCHGEIEEKLVTCSMCGYILDYDSLDVNKDLDKGERILFFIKQNLLFIVKLSLLFFVLAFILYSMFLKITASYTDIDFTSFVAPGLVVIVDIVLIIVVIKGKRKW